MVEDERMDGRGIPADLLDGLLFDLVLDAAAAERAHLAALGIDDHHRAGLLRRRAPGLHHLADDQLAILLQGVDQVTHQVPHAFSIPDSRFQIGDPLVFLIARLTRRSWRDNPSPAGS